MLYVCVCVCIAAPVAVVKEPSAPVALPEGGLGSAGVLGGVVLATVVGATTVANALVSVYVCACGCVCVVWLQHRQSRPQRLGRWVG
jgi:hypothetical protein